MCEHLRGPCYCLLRPWSIAYDVVALRTNQLLDDGEGSKGVSFTVVAPHTSHVVGRQSHCRRGRRL